MILAFCSFISHCDKLSQSIMSKKANRCGASTDGGTGANAPIVPVDEIKRFVMECMCAVGTPEKNAEIFADALIEADYRGIFSHGLNRLDKYIKDVQTGLCDPKAEPSIVTESVSAAVVCGNNGLGAVVGNFCMELAMSKASETGIGMVVANGSNHFGIGSMYTNQALQKGFIGLSFSNTSPVMVPTNAREPALGTNPISIGAPGLNCDNFILDIATTASSLGVIDQLRKKGQKIPEYWALDDKGQMVTDPEVAMKHKKLMPLGGTQSYKGFGLGFLVEVLSGLLADSNYGPNIRIWGGEKPEPANLGHGFIAINPEKFAPNFPKRLSQLMNYIRNLEPVDPNAPVLVPGDRERMNMQTVDRKGGITYTIEQIEVLEKISKELSVRPIELKSAEKNSIKS